MKMDKFVDPMAGFAICAFIETDICTNIKITNNIVAGTQFTAYAVAGHDCGDYSS